MGPIEFIEGSTKWKLEAFNIKFNPKENVRNFTAMFINQNGVRETRTADGITKLIGVNRFDKLFNLLWMKKNNRIATESILLLLTTAETDNNVTKPPLNIDATTSYETTQDASTNTLISEILKQPFAKPITTEKNKKRQKKRMSPFLLNTNDKIVIKRTIINPFQKSFDYLDTCKEYMIDREPTTETNEIVIKRTVIDPFQKSFDYLDTCKEYMIDREPTTETNDDESTTERNKTITQDVDQFTDRIDPLLEARDMDDALSMGSAGTLTQSIININETGLLEVVNRFTSGESIADFDAPVHNRGIKRASFPPGPNKKLCAQMPDLQGNPSRISMQCPQDRTPKVIEIQRNLDRDSLWSHNISTSYSEVQHQTRSLNQNSPMEPQIQKSFTELPQNLGLLSTVQPEEWFNLLSPERLKTMSKKDVEQLKRLQMFIDYKFCMAPDECGYLPIHNATLRNDMRLLKRQCFVLRGNGTSLDIGDENENKSALQLCIENSGDIELVRALLDTGASPLYVDDADRSAVHYAAESRSSDYMQLLQQHLRDHPRFTSCSDKDGGATAPLLAERSRDHGDVDAVLCHAALMLDNNGYTPLMLAARQGNAEHVMLLLEDIIDSGRVANARSPNSGNTALYLAVEAACCEARVRGNMSKVPENYARTIERLIRYGADHQIQNDYNSDVNTIISECSFGAVSSLIYESLEKTKLRSERVMLALENSGRAIEKTMGVNQPFMIVKNGDRLQYLDKNGKKFVVARDLRAFRKVLPSELTSIQEREKSDKNLPVKSPNKTVNSTLKPDAIDDIVVCGTESNPPQPKPRRFLNPDIGKSTLVQDQGKSSSDPPVRSQQKSANENTYSTPISIAEKAILRLSDVKSKKLIKVKIIPKNRIGAYTNKKATEESVLIKNPSALSSKIQYEKERNDNPAFKERDTIGTAGIK